MTRGQQQRLAQPCTCASGGLLSDGSPLAPILLSCSPSLEEPSTPGSPPAPMLQQMERVLGSTQYSSLQGTSRAGALV